MDYLLSIVVPTKDRYFYLKHLIQLVKSFKSDEIELIIQDNTYDNTEILDYIENLNYCHLKYFYTKEQISVSDNSTKAILNSTGEYVCFIGDDDGVTRHIVECVKWMKDNHYDILKSELALYRWPSFNETPSLASSLLLADYSAKFKIIDNRVELKKCVDCCFDNLKNMPKVYNGIVKRTLLDDIYKKTSTYFPGPSPDMANAVALAVLNPSYVYVDFPIILGGRSGISGGNPNQYNNHGCAKIEEVPFLPKDSVANWEKRLPKLWCVETVWPESGIKALRSLKATDYLDQIDYERVLSRFIVQRRWFWKEAFSLSQNKVKLSYLVVCGFLNKKINAKRIEIKKAKGIVEDNLKVYHGVQNIIEAEKMIADKYNSFVLTNKTL